MVITNHIPTEMRPGIPAQPKAVRVFELSTLMGLMVLVIVLIIGISFALGGSHPISTDIYRLP